MPKVTEWKAWTLWGSARDKDALVSPTKPSVTAVVTYLEERGSKGKTAAVGARAALQWWELNVGVPFHTDHERVVPFKVAGQGHVVKETPAVPPWLALNIHRIVAQAEGAVQMMATLLTLILGACLRGRHFQRSA